MTLDELADEEPTRENKLLARARDPVVEIEDVGIEVAVDDLSFEEAKTQSWLVNREGGRVRMARGSSLSSLDIDAMYCASDVVLAACDAHTARAWFRQALTAWRASTTCDPREAELWRRLGDIERQLQRTVEARSAYEHAIECAPSTDSPAAVAAQRALFALDK